jgi:hypothetical protein
MDGAEIEFGDLLVEDQNNAAMSYLDCESQPISRLHQVFLFGAKCGLMCAFVADLCLVHKQIHAVVCTFFHVIIVTSFTHGFMSSSQVLEACPVVQV